MSKPPVSKPTVSQLVDLMPDPFVIIDRDYRIVAANQRYCEHYGTTRESLVGRLCHQVSHHSDVPCHQNGEHCPMIEVYRNRAATNVVHVHYDKSGQEERVQLHATPILDNQGKVAFMGESIFPLQDEQNTDNQLVGRSGVMLRLLSMVQRVAPTETTVLLEGESGVGKECAAEYLHRYSANHTRPFVVLDCATLDENSLERELFGEAPDQKGLIDSAESGTLYLDHVCDLPMSVQTKLLRFIETSSFRRLGGSEYQSIKIRLIASTTRPLLSMVEQGLFRRDLYYRLSAFPVTIPPLRDRIDDIPLLSATLLKRLPNGARHIPLPIEVIEKLLGHDYPGNVRELRNILERAIVLAGDGKISPEHLRFARMQTGSMEKSRQESSGHLSQSEIRVLHALRNNDGNRSRAARSLGVSERTIYRHVRKFRSKYGESFLASEAIEAALGESMSELM